MRALTLMLVLAGGAAEAVPSVGDVKNDIDGFRGHAIGYLAGVRDTLGAEMMARGIDPTCEWSSSPGTMLGWILVNCPNDLDLWRAVMAYFEAHCVPSASP